MRSQPLLYAVFAKLLGTTPIHVRLAADAFTFSRGETRVHVRPLAWFDGADSSRKVVAVGDQPPPPRAFAVDLTSADALAFPAEVCQAALEAVLFFGLKALAQTGTFQRPEIVFQNDGVLAKTFGNEQRQALSNAVSAAHAFGSRFE